MIFFIGHTLGIKTQTLCAHCCCDEYVEMFPNCFNRIQILWQEKHHVFQVFLFYKLNKYYKKYVIMLNYRNQSFFMVTNKYLSAIEQG